MKQKWILSVLILSLFLCLPLAYCLELTSNELKIFYNAQLKAQTGGNNSDSLAQDFATKYGLTEDGLADLMTEGYRIPLNATEKEVVEELKKRLSSSTGEKMMTSDDMNIMKELANKYGMSIGQVGSIFIRMNSDLL